MLRGSPDARLRSLLYRRNLRNRTLDEAGAVSHRPAPVSSGPPSRLTRGVQADAVAFAVDHMSEVAHVARQPRLRQRNLATGLFDSCQRIVELGPCSQVNHD